MADDKPQFTAGEKAQLAWYIARMAKRSLADDGSGNVHMADLQRKVDRIERQALKRKSK